MMVFTGRLPPYLFFRIPVYEVSERVGKSLILYCKTSQNVLMTHFMAAKKVKKNLMAGAFIHI